MVDFINIPDEPLDELSGPMFIFADGVIGDLQRKYVEASEVRTKIIQDLSENTTFRETLLMLMEGQLIINLDATEAVNKNKHDKISLEKLSASNKDINETEQKIKSTNTQIIALEQEKSAVELTLQTLSALLKTAQREKKSSLATPAWAVETDLIKKEIEASHQILNKCSVDLKNLSDQRTKTLFALETQNEILKETQTEIDATKKQIDDNKKLVDQLKQSFWRNIAYYAARATFGIINSDRFKIEMKINQSSEKIKSLTPVEKEKQQSIKSLNTKKLTLDDQIKQTDLTKQETEQTILNATEQLTQIEQSHLDKMNAIKEKVHGIQSFFQKNPILSTISTFISNPTTDNLTSLIQGMNNHPDYLKNAENINLISEIGKIYPPIKTAHDALVQKQQLKNAIIADCNQYIDEKEGVSQTASTVFKKVSSILKTQPQSKQIEVVSDVDVINALKSYLKNDEKAKQSFGIVAKFIQSSIDGEITAISQLLEKASEIDPQIKSIYSAKQAEKIISSAETTLAYKAMLAAEKQDDYNPGPKPT